MPLNGKVAIVSGSRRGIGRHIATALASRGAHIVISGRTNLADAATELRAVAEAIRSSGGSAEAIPCDIGDESQVRALVTKVLDAHGNIDLLVNNAAMRLHTKILDTPPEAMERIIRVNVLGPFLLWLHVVPGMVAAKRGRVIDIVSTNAPVQPFIGMAPYRMTKVGLTLLSADLAMELDGTGVAVNAFDPGPVVSEGTAAIRVQREEKYDLRLPYHGQDPLTVLDAPICWLAEQPASAMTGQFLRRTEFGKTWGPCSASAPTTPRK